MTAGSRRSIRRPTPGKTLRAVSNEPRDSLLEQARRQPYLGPNLIVSIPLSLLPAYLELHHLELLSGEELAKKPMVNGTMNGTEWSKRYGAIIVKRTNQGETR